MTGAGGTGAGGALVKKGCWNTPTGNHATGATLNQEGKIVLFDGTSMAEWKKAREANIVATDWFIDPNDRTMVVKHTTSGPTTDMQSRRTFEDVCLHVEYMTPELTDALKPDQNQSRGNSGVYLKSAYEIQILDSHSVLFNAESCGAIYKIRRPNVSACNQKLVWNTLEIEFKASKWTGSARTTTARFVSVTLNGMLVQGGDDLRAVEIQPLVTEAGIEDRAGPQPLMLQDHRWPVKFQNMWVRVPQY